MPNDSLTFPAPFFPHLLLQFTWFAVFLPSSFYCFKHWLGKNFGQEKLLAQGGLSMQMK